MTTSKNFQRHIKMLKESGQYIAPGSEAHKTLLSGGYGGFTEDEAKSIIAERDKNPVAHTLADYKRAKAFLAALKAKPRPISTRPAFRRPKTFTYAGDDT
jgi:hypothetical protein